MPRRGILWVLSLLIVAAAWISCDANAETNFPCAGCVVFGEESGEPRPLLVVLHGDEGSPTRVLGAWKLAAERAHVTLFAPRCPTSEGCAGSWWRWDGDPAWLLGRVEALSKRFPIDPKRRYLAGWSGGTTYASFYVPRWFPTFAAVSLAGGGAPPHSDECLANAGGACAPIHYLAGDKNPLFSLAEGARSYLEKCGHAVTWELHPGADHAGEWRVYEREAAATLGWLLAHPEGCALVHEADPAVASSSDAAPPLTKSAEPAASPTTIPAPVPSGSRIQPEPRCTCSLDASRTSSSRAVGLSIAACALVARRARKARSRSRQRGGV